MCEYIDPFITLRWALSLSLYSLRDWKRANTVCLLSVSLSISTTLKYITELANALGIVNSLVNNAGVWKSRPTAGPADGPEAFGAAMFDEDIEGNWRECTSIAFFSSLFSIDYHPINASQLLSAIPHLPTW